jgi:hypothetical protein
MNSYFQLHHMWDFPTLRFFRPDQTLDCSKVVAIVGAMSPKDGEKCSSAS